MGITPACAGKSRHRRRSPARVKDHPRVCGEKELCALAGMAEAGSPPRVRGKDDLDIGAGQDQGITPACAGKSLSKPIPCKSHRDHPRVCGEKRSVRWVHQNHLGSPPRVRGKDAKKERCKKMKGITPACAGKSTYCIFVPGML